MDISYADVALPHTEYVFSVHSEEIFPMGTFFSASQILYIRYKK